MAIPTAREKDNVGQRRTVRRNYARSGGGYLPGQKGDLSGRLFIAVFWHFLEPVQQALGEG